MKGSVSGSFVQVGYRGGGDGGTRARARDLVWLDKRGVSLHSVCLRIDLHRNLRLALFYCRQANNIKVFPTTCIIKTTSFFLLSELCTTAWKYDPGCMFPAAANI